MADNIAVTPGTGATIGAEDVGGGVLVQRVKVGLGVSGTAVDAIAGNGVSGTGVQRVTIASDSTGVVGLNAGTAYVGQVGGNGGTCSTDVTRPADTNAYAVGDAWADSTSAPTAGGFTLTGAGRASGGSGVITDMIITSGASPATTLQGEIWIFDSAVTAINDNAAFTVSDSDIKLLVGVVPFTLLAAEASSPINSYVHVQGLSIGYTCVGTANLRYLIKVQNAYVPTSGEVLTVRAKTVQTN